MLRHIERVPVMWMCNGHDKVDHLFAVSSLRPFGMLRAGHGLGKDARAICKRESNGRIKACKDAMETVMGLVRDWNELI